MLLGGKFPKSFQCVGSFAPLEAQNMLLLGMLLASNWEAV